MSWNLHGLSFRVDRLYRLDMFAAQVYGPHAAWVKGSGLAIARCLAHVCCGAARPLEGFG